MFSDLNGLHKLLAKSLRVTVLTGSGVSAECGIPVFRGESGIWNDHKPEDLATMKAFKRSPELVWAFYNWRRGLIRDSGPGPSHLAIAEMGKKWDGFTLITQNVDGLHEAAGSDGVKKLHGSIWQLVCIRCDYRREDREEWTEVPKCPKCGNNLRPDVVWFGEPLDNDMLDQSINAALSSQVFISVGTSLMVQPAASLAMLAKQSGAATVEINPQKTFYTGEMDYVFNVEARDILPKLIA